MNTIFLICRAITVGIIVGFFCGGLKLIFKKKPSETNNAAARKFINQLSVILKYITFLVLAIGLVWCCYFLLLGITNPELAEYANNMSSLIVAILTVISIIFAFVEFMRRT